jgi:hypothetical protein
LPKILYRRDESLKCDHQKLGGNFMNIPEKLYSLAGEWVGTKRLWLSPEAPESRSAVQAVVSLVAQQKFLSIGYSWEYEGAPQDGLLLVGFNSQGQVEQAVWVDSWHMNDQMMLLTGESSSAGPVMLRGSYPAPPGPDWGWWIEMDPGDGALLKVLMHNVSPEGQAVPAVEIVLDRA